MEKSDRVLRKHHSSSQLSTGNITPRRGRSLSRQMSSKILQNESLPSERSLQIDKSMVHHLDSVAATPGNIRPRRMLNEETDVSSITMTPGWTKYMDQTYHLRSAKQSSQHLVSDDSSVTDPGGNFEAILKSPGKGPRFQRKHRNLIPKNVGSELFRAALTSPAPQGSVMLPPQEKGVGEISVEDHEEMSPIVSQMLKRRRNVKTNTSVFQDAFEDSVPSLNSTRNISNRHEESSLRNSGASLKASLSNRSRKKQVDELEQETDISSNSASPNTRQSKSSEVLAGLSGRTKNAAFTSGAPQGSVMLPPPIKGVGEISVEDHEEASPVVSQTFKRRRKVKTNPAVFQDAFEDSVPSSLNSTENVSNSRHEESRQRKNSVASLQVSLRNRSGLKQVNVLEHQSNVLSNSASSNTRRSKSSDVVAGPPGRANNAASTSLAPQGSVMLPPQEKGVGEISVEDHEEMSPIVSQMLKRRRNVKTNPSVFQDAFEDSVPSPNSTQNVSNRHEESSLRNTGASLKASLSNRSRKKQVNEMEQETDILSNSASPNTRQSKSSEVLAGPSGRVKNAAFTSGAPQGSVMLPPPIKGVGEISVEDHEEASPVVSQTFKRRRKVKTNPAVFQDAFEDYVSSSLSSTENVSNRHDVSRQKNSVASLQVSLSSRSGKKRVNELEWPSDGSSDLGSPKTRQSKSSEVLTGSSGRAKHAAFTSGAPQGSVMLPPPTKGVSEISVEDHEEASPVVSQTFKRRRNVKTNPAVFQDAFEDSVPSSLNSTENVSNRHEESRQRKNSVASLQASLRSRSEMRQVNDWEHQLPVPSNSASPNTRRSKSLDVVAGPPGLANNAAFTSLAPQDSVTLPPQPNGVREISVEDHEEASPVVSQTLKGRRNVKTNPSVFQDAFEDSVPSSLNSAQNVSNRHEESRQKNSVASLQASLINRSRNKQVNELEKQPDVSSDTETSNTRQSKSSEVLAGPLGRAKHAAFTSSTPRTSVMLPPLRKGVGEVSVEDQKVASSVVSKKFKRRGNVETYPSFFPDAFEDSFPSSVSSTDTVSNRHEESRQKNAGASHPASPSNRSGKKQVNKLDQQSDVLSGSGSPNTRQSKSSEVLAAPSGQAKNNAITSPMPQSSVMLPPQPKGVGEISVEDHEEASPIVSQTFRRRRNVEIKSTVFQSVVVQFVTSPTPEENVSNRLEDLGQMKNVSTSANGSDSNKEIGHVQTLVEQSDVPSNIASVSNRQLNVESVDIRPGFSKETGRNETQNTSYKSVRPQNVAWFRRWQEKAAATGSASAFNLLPRQERTAKLEEFVRNVKQKHEALKSPHMKRPFIRKLEGMENVKVTQPVPKKKSGVRPLRPDLLVDGKRYLPRLKRPKSWATQRLYKLVIPKCEEKYGSLKAHRKAEGFIVLLCEKVSTVIRCKKYEKYEGILEEIKRALYKLGIIKCLMEYFVFIENYLPREYRIKAIPCLRAYGKNTGPPMAPDTDLFADLNY